MAERIPRDFIELMLAKIDIIDLINARIPLKKKSGSNYFARCPFHNEKSASFSVSQPKQFYHCFGCGAHGNAIDFLIQHDQLPFPEAVETLARQAGMEIPRDANAPKRDDSLPALFALMTEVTTYYYDQMCHAERAISYLKKRGISGAIAKTFLLGYASPGWSHLLDHFGKTDADKKKLQDAGLIIKKDEGGFYDRFRDRIMFPIHDYRGRIIGFGGRILDQGEPKYLNSPETPLFQKGHELYGLYQALKTNRKLDRVMLVEGYMDVIALFQHGITYAVATLGTATTEHHIKRLYRYTSDIIFCFDGDQAGRTAAWRALLVLFPLLQDNLQIRFLFLPDGHDPDSLIREEGKEAFEQRVQTAMPLSDFFLQTISQQSDMNTMEGRARLAATALNHIKQIPEGIFQGILLSELSKRTRVDVNELKQQIKTTGEIKPIAITTNQEQDELGKSKLATPMRLAIGLLIQHPHLAEFIEETLPEAALSGAGFFNCLVVIIKETKNITTGMLLERFRSEKEEAFVMKLAAWNHMVPETGIKQEFLGALRQLAAHHLQHQIDRLLAKAAQEPLSDQEKAQLTELIAKKQTVAEV
jgi:DNA primase